MANANSFTLTLIALALIAFVAVNAGPYATSREMSPLQATDLYFPTNCVTGDDDCNQVLTIGQRFPAVIFLQGGSVDAQYYSSIVTKIASFGYIVAVPNAPRSFMFGVSVQLTSPNATLGARALLRALDTTPTSGIYGRLLDNAYSIVGHSFGGVMATVAGANDAAALCAFPNGPLMMLCNGFGGFGPGLKAVVTFGSSMVDRNRLGGVTVFNPDTTGIPNILIRGKNDGRVLLTDVQTTYDSSLESPKAFIELDHANHFGITDSQEIAGGSRDTNLQSKSQDWSTSQIAKLISTALNAHVKNDATALSKIYVTRSFGPPFITVSASQQV